MTVAQVTIQALTTTIKVSAVLSRTGTRKVFPDSDTALHPLSFHSVFPLWYLRRPNLLSSISTILLGPPIFTKQPSGYTLQVRKKIMGRQMVIGTQNHETEYQMCTQKFWRGGGVCVCVCAGSLYSFIQFDLKNCSNKYNITFWHRSFTFKF